MKPHQLLFEAEYECTIPHYYNREKTMHVKYGVDQVKYEEVTADEDGNIRNTVIIRDRVFVDDGDDITYIWVEYYEEKYYEGTERLRAWCDKCMPWLWTAMDVIYPDLNKAKEGVTK